MTDSGTADEGTYRTPARAFQVVVIALGLATLVFLGVLKRFNDTALVTTALGALFSLFGTVVGAYFGIKVTSDTIDKTQSERKRLTDRADTAHAKSEEALAALPPTEAQELLSRIQSGS
jgi:hypothetical protein